jgi:hypothetical protein
MSAINFPDSPVSGQIFSSGLMKWQWNTVVWSPIANSSSGGAISSDSIWDAKGDIAVATGPNSASKLAVSSTNRHVPFSDSSTSTGLNFGDPANLHYFFHDWLFGTWTVDGGSTTPQAYGIPGATNQGTPSMSTMTSSKLRSISYVSAATTGSDAGAATNTHNCWLTHEWIIVFWGGPDTLTNIRYIVGAAVSGGDMSNYDDGFNGEGAWFRYSTSASDTTWKCITSNDTAGGPTITDTGITVTTGTKKFMIHKTTSNVKFYLDDVLVATNTTDLPDNSDTMAILAGRGKTLADAAATVHFVQCLVLTRIP